MWIVWDKRKKVDSTNLRWVLLKDEYDEWREHYDKCSNSSGG